MTTKNSTEEMHSNQALILAIVCAVFEQNEPKRMEPPRHNLEMIHSECMGDYCSCRSNLSTVSHLEKVSD